MEDDRPCLPDIARSDLLDERQHRAIEALILGHTRAQAAKAAGVDVSTLFRWTQRPEFRSHLRRMSEAATELALNRAGVMGEAMLRTLELIALDPALDARVRVRAAKDYLEFSRRSRRDERLAGDDTNPHDDFRAKAAKIREFLSAAKEVEGRAGEAPPSPAPPGGPHGG